MECIRCHNAEVKGQYSKTSGKTVWVCSYCGTIWTQEVILDGLEESEKEMKKDGKR